MKKFMILPWDYHGKKQYVLIKYSTIFIFNDIVYPQGVKVLDKKGDNLVELAYSYIESKEMWRYNLNNAPGIWCELKLTKKFYEELKLDVEDDASARLLFELKEP